MRVDTIMIRLADLSELDGITALINDAFQGYTARLGRKPQPLTDDYAALVAASEVWILQEDITLIGVLVVQKVGKTLLVRTVAITPHRQRQGLGKQLMAEAERLAQTDNITKLHLYTNEVMTGNIELYKHLGYTETHRTGPEGKQVIYMKKELT